MAVITNASGANTALVKSDGSLLIAPTDNVNEAGFVIMSGEITSANSGNARLARPMDVSFDYRLRTGIDSLLWHDQWNHGVLNTQKYIGVTSTMTMTVAGGFLNLNAGSSVTSGHVARLQTWRSFPLYSNFPLYVEFWAGTTVAAQAANVIEFGLGFASGTSAPTDGVFFRLNGATSFQGVVNYNGVESTTGDITGHIPAAGEINHYLIAIHLDRVEFYKNDEMIGYVVVPTSNPGPTYSQSLPLLIREYNSGAVSLAQVFKVGAVSVTHGDIVTNRLWPTVMAGMGLSSITVPDGVAVGYTANYANSAAPASAAVTVIAGGYATLGGQWQYAAAAGSEVDLCMFAYQVPPTSVILPGRNLVIRGIRIDTVITGAAVATTATVIQFGLGVGSSAITPATADSGTAGTRAIRRIPLGIVGFPVASAIGTTQSIDINLDAPIVCEPGTYVQIYYKQFIGTATGSQINRGTCMINGYWE
jgi:hypothetical protein